MKVKLEVVGTGPYIKAPSHCPYALLDKSFVSQILTVNSSICPLCKLCDFTLPKEEIEFKTEEFVKYLNLINTNISVSINNQNYYLKKNERIPLIILINPSVFDSMLNLIYKDDKDTLYKVKSYFLTNESPICHILGCPVYLSRKLTKSEVMVVGEVSWK
jgi:hypothetical protein